MSFTKVQNYNSDLNSESITPMRSHRVLKEFSSNQFLAISSPRNKKLTHNRLANSQHIETMEDPQSGGQSLLDNNIAEATKSSLIETGHEGNVIKSANRVLNQEV